MFFSRVGRRRINLNYLIMLDEIEENGVPIVRVTMDQGEKFDVHASDARQLVETVDHLADQPIPAAVTTVITAGGAGESAGFRPFREAGT
jgi:hypothetical protein